MIRKSTSSVSEKIRFNGKCATAGLPNGASIFPENTAGQASSGTRLFQQAGNAGQLLAATPTDRDFPLSQWYVMPIANFLAQVFSPTAVRPLHVTLCGFLSAVIAVFLLCWWPGSAFAAALFVWFAWLCDRIDGKLARVQGTTSQRGAWLDANVDELTDVAFHVGLAYAATMRSGSHAAWMLVILFLAGKYLFTYGLGLEQEIRSAGHSSRRDSQQHKAASPPNHAFDSHTPNHAPKLWRWLYHLPGNADIRMHLLLGALLLGWFEAELLLVAGYYNFRWLARYVLVPQRLAGPAQSLSGHDPWAAANEIATDEITDATRGITASPAARSSAKGATA